MEQIYYKQPYTIAGIDLERIDDKLTFTIENSKNESIKIFVGLRPDKAVISNLIAIGYDSVFTVELARHNLPYYFYAEIGNKETPVFSERILPLEEAINIRDLGGYKTKDGKRLRWGLLYRGDHLTKLTDSDIEILERIGIKTVIDFRSDHERRIYPNKKIKTVMKTVNCNPQSHFSELAGTAINLEDENRKLIEDLDKGSIDSKFINNSGLTSILSYKELVAEPVSQKAFKTMIHELISPESIPSLQHCRGGKDRTGFGVMLVLMLLGVSEDQIIADYLITRTVREKRNEVKRGQYERLTSNKNYLDYLMSLIDARPEYIKTAIELINQQYGGIHEYAKNILNLSEAQIEQMKEYYLEG